jgi:hypothetical protein
MKVLAVARPSASVMLENVYDYPPTNVLLPHFFPPTCPECPELISRFIYQPQALLFSLFSLPLASQTCPCIFSEYVLGDFWVARDLVPLVAAAVKRHDEGTLVIETRRLRERGVLM